MTEVSIPNAEAMEHEATRFVLSLLPKAIEATLITLQGDLGAGKTAFVKGIGRALGVAERITSPTFVIMKIYDLEGQRFSRLIHIDAYRLKGEHHLKVLGWDDLLSDPQNLICMEWPEQAGNALPESAIRMVFRYSGEYGRTITYENSETVSTT